MRTSPKTITCVISLAIATAACSPGAHRSQGTHPSSTTTTISPVEAQVLAGFTGALDIEYEIGSQPATAGDMQAANALSQDPRLAAAFTGVAYTQTWMGIADAHMNGIQGPATYTLAYAHVSALSLSTKPAQASVQACLFDTGNVVSATHQTVMNQPGLQAGWSWGTWTLIDVGGLWKVSNFSYHLTPTTDGGHPKCGN